MATLCLNGKMFNGVRICIQDIFERLVSFGTTCYVGLEHFSDERIVYH